MPTPDLLHRLLRAPGPSGHETAPAEVWREACAAFTDDVRADRVGSSVARVPGTAGAPTLAVIGHIDEIGLHVSHIDDEGFLRFGEVGGWDPIQLVGQRVRLSTRGGDLLGVIGRKPIHLIQGDDRDRAPKLKDLHIDIGAGTGDEAREMVRIGDVAVIDVEPLSLPNERLVSRSLDNRIGCYVAAEAARLVAAQGGAPGEMLALAVAQEETTFAGARTSAYGLNPDLAIVVDVTHATDQPGVELGPVTVHKLGSGPVIARGTMLHPAVTGLLHDVAEELDMAFSVESLGRGTGTDADAVHVARAGIPTGLVSVPLRYMHSAVELVALSDIEATARLIAAFAQHLAAGMSFER
ncbi:MAG: M20/M25/M40 family metallo-hydrolase [Solirubrobacterales bacterium]|nr:M20/M25/M40 family metallo-hydrolase [Solirubrobacterales bacterium]